MTEVLNANRRIDVQNCVLARHGRIRNRDLVCFPVASDGHLPFARQWKALGCTRPEKHHQFQRTPSNRFFLYHVCLQPRIRTGHYAREQRATLRRQTRSSRTPSVMRLMSTQHESCRDDQCWKTAFIGNSAARLVAPMVQRCISCASLSAPMVQPTHRSCNVKVWLVSCARSHPASRLSVRITPGRTCVSVNHFLDRLKFPRYLPAHGHALRPAQQANAPRRPDGSRRVHLGTRSQP